MKSTNILAAVVLATLSGGALADQMYDYGDALSSYGAAGAADGSQVYLGRIAPNYEYSPKYATGYGAPANGDQGDDGVEFIGSFVDQAGTTAYGLANNYYAGYWGKVTVTIHATNHASLTGKIFLDGWMDWGHNGIFDDQSGVIPMGPNAGTAWTERSVSAVLDPGTWTSDEMTFTYTFMNGNGPEGPFYARFRVNYAEGVNTATALTNTGEVEDYGGGCQPGDVCHAGQHPIPEPTTGWLLFGPLVALTGRWWLRRA